MSHSNLYMCISWNDHCLQVLTSASLFKVRESCFVIHKFDVTDSGRWSRLALIFRLKNDNKIQFPTLICFQNELYYPHLRATSLTAHLYTVELSENLGWIMWIIDWNRYLIIGAVICYEYSNIWYLHFIVCNTQKIGLGVKNDFRNYIFALFCHWSNSQKK